MTQQETTQPPSGDFRLEVGACLSELRNALADALHEAGAVPGGRPQDLARLLRIDKNLAWKVARVTESRDPISGVQHLMGRQGLSIFLKAAARAGASDAQLERCERAMDQFESLVERHAGDRATFETLASECSREVMERANVRILKQFYQSAGFVWGIQAASQLVCRIFAPSEEDPACLDYAHIGGFGDLRRLRESAFCSLGRWFHRPYDDPNMPDRAIIAAERIDPSTPEDEAPFLTEFCTQPLPETRVLRHPDGTLEYRLEGTIVGAGSLSTVMIGSVLRGLCSRYQRAESRYLTLEAPIETPVETLYVDALLHEDLLPWMRPIPRIRSLLRPSERGPGNTHAGEELPLPISITELGRNITAGANNDMPEYGRMMEYTFEKLGWDPRRFHLFRLGLSYPPVATKVIMQMPQVPPSP